MQQFLEYAVLEIALLVPFEGNARKHDEAKLGNSVIAHGQYRTVVVRKQDPPEPEYTILAGHGTVEAMRAKGHTKVRCELIACTDEEALSINLVDNRTSDLATYDPAALASQLEAAREFAFEGTGWDLKAAAQYLDPDAGDNGPAGDPPSSTWAIIIECRDEEQQADLLKKFDEEGLSCRPLIA
jgi:hypothetical protein